MLKVATASAKAANGEEAAESALRAALEKSGLFKADTVIFFPSFKLRRSFEKILRKIKGLSGARNVVGASAYGVITEDGELERQAAVAVMVIGSDEIDTQSFLLPNLQENNMRAGENLARQLQSSGLNANLMLLFPDPFSFQSNAFFDGFENAHGYLPIIGGAAGEDGREEKTYQMEGDRVTFDAISGLALAGNFRTEIAVTRSCQPFGEPCRITRAEGNMIYEIDGRPAYDILLESLSQIECDNPEQIFERVFLGVPVRSFQTDFLGSPYLIQNIMGVNVKKGMLATMSPVEEGEFVTFTVRDPALARKDMREILEGLKLRLDGVKPPMAFYFNCCARGEMLYGKSNEDTTLIRRYFPDVPVLGFFTYGEIAPLDHVNHLHHHSGVLTMIAPQS